MATISDMPPEAKWEHRWKSNRKERSINPIVWRCSSAFGLIASVEYLRYCFGPERAFLSFLLQIEISRLDALVYLSRQQHFITLDFSLYTARPSLTLHLILRVFISHSLCHEQCRMRFVIDIAELNALK